VHNKKSEHLEKAMRHFKRFNPSGWISVLAAAMMTLVLAACSSSVQITSEPSGANVDINGESYGKTPADITLSDFDFNVYRLTLTKLGYTDKTVTLAKEIKIGPFVGGFFSLYLTWLWCYGPKEEFYFKLEPSQGIESAPEEKPSQGRSQPVVAEIEENIPEVARKNPDAVAVVIGISNYKSHDIPEVTYAVKGADLVRNYFEKTFGIDKRKVIFATDENASLADFRKIFEEKLKNYITPGKSDVYIYYQGHGVPDPETKEAYFVPYDCDPSYAKSTGYPLKEFYSRLAALPAKSLTVILDACFSGASAGGALVKNISPLYMKVKTPVVTMNNAVVFTSSTGEQVSCWYPDKNESLFTYYFLKGLTGDADLDQDGTITNGEMQGYLEQNVPVEARYLSNREQTPQMMTKDPGKVLLKYK